MTKLQTLLQEMANRLERSIVKSILLLKLSARNLQTENICMPIIPQEGHNVDLTHEVNQWVWNVKLKPSILEKKSTFIWFQLRKEIWNLNHIWRTYNKIVELPLPCHGTIANSVTVSNSIHMLGCWKLQNTGDHRTYFRNVCRFQSDGGFQKWPNPNCEAKVRNYNFFGLCYLHWFEAATKNCLEMSQMYQQISI